MDETIQLLPHEIFDAAQVGIRRRVASRKEGRPDTNRLRSSSEREYQQWGIDVEGACAERAAAKMLGRYWEGGIGSRHSNPDDGDVGRLQVRTTCYANGKLIIRPDDDDNAVFLLMVGTARNGFRPAGWLQGKDAKHDEFIQNPNGAGKAWFVPQDKLHPVATLPKDATT